jgi:hypothetical protein
VIRHPAGISPGQPPCANARAVDHKRPQARDGPAYRSNVRCRCCGFTSAPPAADPCGKVAVASRETPAARFGTYTFDQSRKR